MFICYLNKKSYYRISTAFLFILFCLFFLNPNQLYPNSNPNSYPNSYPNYNPKSTNLLVLPVQYLETKPKYFSRQQQNIITKKLTEIIQTYLLFSGFGVSNFKTAQKVFSTIKKQKLNINNISTYFKSLNELDYIIVSQFYVVNDKYYISFNVNRALDNTVLISDKHSISTIEYSFISRDIYTSVSSMVSLINPMGKQIVDMLDIDKRKKHNITGINFQEVNRFQIMFILSSSARMKSNLRQLRVHLRDLVSSIYSKHKGLNIEIAIISDEHLFPFTSDVVKAQENIEYIERSALTQLESKKDFISILNKGINYKGWSVSSNDSKLIFIFTDDPFKMKTRLKKVTDNIVSPLKYALRSNTPVDEKQLKIIADMFKRSIADVLNSRHYSMRNLSNINVKYLVDSLLIQDRDLAYRFNVGVRDLATGSLVHSIKTKSSWGFLGIQQDIKYIQYKLKVFFDELISAKRKDILENVNNRDYSSIMRIAANKSIKLFVVGVSDAQENTQDLLVRLAQMLGGYYINPEYNILAYREGGKQYDNFIYKFRKLYKIFKEQGRTYKELISKDVNGFEAVESILASQGYGILESSTLYLKLSKVINRIYLQDKVQESIDARLNRVGFILKSDGYNYPLELNNVNISSLNNLLNLVKTKKEVIIASRIIPVTPYKVSYEGKSEREGRILNFSLSENNVIIFNIDNNKAISEDIISRIEDINKKVYLYNSKGLLKNGRIWFIRGVLAFSDKPSILVSSKIE